MSVPFEHAQSMSKWTTVSVYIANYLTYLSASLPKGLEVDLEGSTIFPILMLLMHIDKLGLYNHLC